MSTKLFNIPANTLRPGPTLTIVRDTDGNTTATMDFTCRKYDVGKATIQAKLRQGTQLLELYPQAGTEFDYLLVHNWTARDEPGGITTVTVEFKGVDLGTGGDFSFDSSLVYIRNNSLRELPIWQHPKLIEELSGTEIDAIKEVVNGTAYYSYESGSIKRLGSDLLISALTSDEAIPWYELIVTQGHETFLFATSEWTKTATGKGTIPDQLLEDFGKISTPPGNPGAPTNHTWLFTGATENISVLGNGQNSYSLTYTSGEWATKIYSPAAP